MNILKEEKIHEHGFVRLLEVMGSDEAIEDAARISYGHGTRKTSETRSLIRYLVRHRHTTPLEQGVLRFHIKLPIFVMRQHIRHRTASVNEYSARYSEMSDEFYTPADSHIAPQSKSNKQGREGDFDPGEKEFFSELIRMSNKHSFQNYQSLLKHGLSREIARTVLPVSNYTECIWQINLHNLMHYLTLRTDSHAQREIQDFANAILYVSRPSFPRCFEAWDDYHREARTLSRMEIQLLRDLKDPRKAGTGNKEDYDMSQREWQEFWDWWSNL